MWENVIDLSSQCFSRGQANMRPVVELAWSCTGQWQPTLSQDGRARPCSLAATKRVKSKSRYFFPRKIEVNISCMLCINSHSWNELALVQVQSAISQHDCHSCWLHLIMHHWRHTHAILVSLVQNIRPSQCSNIIHKHEEGAPALNELNTDASLYQMGTISASRI